MQEAAASILHQVCSAACSNPFPPARVNPLYACRPLSMGSVRWRSRYCVNTSKSRMSGTRFAASGNSRVSLSSYIPFCVLARTDSSHVGSAAAKAGSGRIAFAGWRRHQLRRQLWFALAYHHIAST